jgi:hypothetical protein
MSTIDITTDLNIAINLYKTLKLELKEHEENEPIGFTYDKRDKYFWSCIFQEIYNDIKLVEDKLKILLDQQLDEYFKGDVTKPTWDKNQACLLLKRRLLY